MNILMYVFFAVVLVGFWMIMFYPETSRKRYLGWFIMAVAVTVWTAVRWIASDITTGSIIWNICIMILDYFLAYFWYGKYKEAKEEKELKKLNNRERFLREIKNKKW